MTYKCKKIYKLINFIDFFYASSKIDSLCYIYHSISTCIKTRMYDSQHAIDAHSLLSLALVHQT